MKKASTRKQAADLRKEYDLTRLAGGIRGKYYPQAVEGTNLVLLEPELARVFRDAASVNRALRLLLKTAESAANRSGTARSTTRGRIHLAK